MTFEVPALGYDFNALEPNVDAKTMEIHHDKHHAAYVAKLNAAVEGTEFAEMEVNDLLKDLDKIPENIRQAVINHGGGHSNHSLFWQVLKKDGGKPSEELLEAIKEAFDSPDNYHNTFVEEAGKVFGSGWCWLVVNKEKKLEIVTTKNQDSPISQGLTPIFCIDVWEHSYYISYQNRRPEYLEQITKVINWDKVNELYMETIK